MEVTNNAKIEKVVGRKKDFIRKYFDTQDDNICCNVDNCKKLFSMKSSTSTLKYHILTYHADTPIKHIPSNSIELHMNDLDENDDEIELYSTLSLFFSKNSLPHSLIENKYFKNVMEIIKKSKSNIIPDLNKK